MINTASGRRAGVLPLRRAARYVLVVGIVLAVASAFGPIWIVRAGLLAAIVGGVLAVRFAWREVAQARTEHARTMTHTAESQGEALTVERRRTGEVLQTLRAHNAQADEAVSRLETNIGELRTELDWLRGANATLQADVIERDHRIRRLRSDLEIREAELRALREAEGDAEVLAMPRHAASATAAAKTADALPTAEEIFGEHPKVVDLQKLAFPTAGVQQLKQA